MLISTFQCCSSFGITFFKLIVRDVRFLFALTVTVPFIAYEQLSFFFFYVFVLLFFHSTGDFFSDIFKGEKNFTDKDYEKVDTLSLKSDSHLPKKYICFNDCPSEVMKNAFCLILKPLFVLKIVKFLS